MYRACIGPVGLHPEPIFPMKKDLSLHCTVELEVLSFGNGDTALSNAHFWDGSPP
jgi:hypothetical protein